MNLLNARSWEPVVVMGRASYSRTLQSAKPLKRNQETYSLYVEGTWDDPPTMPESALSWRATRKSTPRRRQVLVSEDADCLCRLPSAVRRPLWALARTRQRTRRNES